MARRTIGWMVALAATTAVVGCGGEDDSAFVEATNKTCENVTAAAKALSTDLVRGPGDSESAAVRGAIERYVTSVTASADQLQAAKPSKSEREFQRLAVAHLREYAGDLKAAAEGGTDGESQADAVKRLTATEGSPAPMVPPAVLDGAPACAEDAAR